MIDDIVSFIVVWHVNFLLYASYSFVLIVLFVAWSSRRNGT